MRAGGKEGEGTHENASALERVENLGVPTQEYQRVGRCIFGVRDVGKE